MKHPHPRRTVVRTLIAVLASAVTLVGAAACTPGVPGDPGTPGVTSAPPTPSASPTPTPTQTPTPSATPTPESDQELAEQTVIAWYRTLDEVGQRKLPISALKKYGTGAALELDTSNQEDYRRKGWKVTGRTKVALTFVRIAAQTDGSHTAQFTACLNVSKVVVVDRNGKSVVSPERKDVYPVTVTVTKAKGASEWMYSREKDGGTKC